MAHTGGALLQRLLDFAQDCRAADPRLDYPHSGDVQWWFRERALDEADRWQFWEDAQGRVAAVALSSAYPAAYLLHPAAAPGHYHADLCRWAVEQRAQRPELARRADIDLYFEAFADDTPTLAWLEETGYRPYGAAYIRYEHSLAASVAAPAPPAGFALRPVQPTDDIHQRATVQYEAHERARQNVPYDLIVEKQLRSRGMPGYDFELDVIATAPDGTWAGECTGWFDSVCGDGVIEPVGVLPAYRRRGLATALVTQVMRQLQARGASKALLLTAHPAGDVKYERPDLVYQSIGFRETRRILGFGRRC